MQYPFIITDRAILVLINTFTQFSNDYDLFNNFNKFCQFGRGLTSIDKIAMLVQLIIKLKCRIHIRTCIYIEYNMSHVFCD